MPMVEIRGKLGGGTKKSSGMVSVRGRLPSKVEEPEEVQYTSMVTRRGELPKTLTKEELLAQTIFGEAKAHMMFTPWRRSAYQYLSGIDPEKTYYIPEYLQPKGTEGYTPSYKLVTGTELKGMLQKQIFEGQESYFDYIKDIKEFKTTIMDFPKGTTFKVTEKGYEPVIPEKQQLEWGKQAWKQTEQLPVGLQQLSKINLGGWSAIWALSKPFADVFGVGKEFEEKTSWFVSKGMHQPLWGLGKTNIETDYQKLMESGRFGVHYVSPLDFAFERIGWSPKGSSEFMTKRPLFLAGGLGGELLQVTAFTIPSQKAIQYGTKGMKGVITHLPKGIGKLNITFPKFFTKFGQTTVMKNIYRWGAKGWRKGLRFAPGTHYPKKAVSKFGEEVFKKVPYIRTEKVWLSPSKYAAAQKKLMDMLSKGGLNISFPLAKKVEGGTRLIGVMSYEKYAFKGIFKKSLVRTYWSYKYFKPLIVSSKIYWKKLPSTYTGFTRKLGERIWVDEGTRILTKKATGIIPSKLKMPITYYHTIDIEDFITKGVIKETVGVREFKDVFIRPSVYAYGFRGKTGFSLVGLQPPLPSKWIQTKLTRKIPGLLSIGELGKPQLIHRPVVSWGKKFGTTQIPGAITLPPITTNIPFITTGWTVSKLPILGVKQLHLPKQITERKSAFAQLPVTITRHKTGTFPIVTTISLQETKTKQLLGFDVLPIQKQKTFGITIAKPKHHRPLEMYPKIPFLWYPKIDLYGKGRRFAKYDLWEEIYKFRMFELKSPFKPIKINWRGL